MAVVSIIGILIAVVLALVVTFSFSAGPVMEMPPVPESAVVAEMETEEAMTEEAMAAETMAEETMAAETVAEEAMAEETMAEEAAASLKYKDGTYTGTGRGMGGNITVTLTIAGDVITVDEITGPYETPGVGGKEAIEDGTFKAQIEEVQSSEIEGVAGATMSSGGVRKAVEDALSQAKQ